MRGFEIIGVLAVALLLLCTSRVVAQTTPTPTDLPPEICDKCDCTELVPNTPIAIDCTTRGLPSIPVVMLQELEARNIHVSRIDLSHNKISHVRANDLRPIGTILNTIDLRWNNILSIEDRAFADEHFPALVALHLSHNKLLSLPRNAIKHLSLTILDLSHNRLLSVPKALRETVFIDTLNLNNNPISQLANDSLDGISGVSTLDLSACNLSVFEPCAYDPYFFLKLNTLYLDLNHLTIIQKSYFDCEHRGVTVMGALRSLSMKYSGITSIEKKAFSKVPQLERLYLGGNNLGIFKGQVFNALVRLIELDLSDCNITDLKGVLFKDSKLEYLYLNNNNIRVIHQGDFRFLAGIQEIDLSSSNIELIDGRNGESPFKNLTSLLSLSLSHNLLDDESIEGLSAGGHFVFLNLANNSFTRIPNLEAAKFPRLRELLMSDNSITKIKTEHLQGMSQLQELILKDNDIEYIEEDAFEGIPGITNLDLDDMRIGRLPRLPLPKLVTLYLRYGALEALPEDLCEQCPSLLYLEAEQNKISSLPSFRGCRLKFLAVHHNLIETLDNGTLERQFSLNFLQLDYNFIETIPDGFFHDTVNMEFLFFRHNNIDSMTPDHFSTMPHLIDVEFGENQISHLEENTFKNQVAMKILGLEHNHLTEFGSTVLPVNSTLAKLNLSVNDLNEVRFPAGGLLELVVLDLEANFDLLQVPDIAEYPNVTDIRYTYAYHCCIWQDYVWTRPYVDHDLNNTVPTIIPTAPPIEELEGDCIDGNFTEESILIHQQIAETFNVTILFLPGCIIQVITNSEDVVTSEEDDVFKFVTERSGYTPPVRHSRMVMCTPRPDELTPCNNLMDPWFLRVCVWALWILAVLGNVTVLFFTFISKEKMEVYQFLICCLAFADLCMGIYLAFLAATDVRTFGDVSFYQAALQWQLSAGCKAAGFIAVFGSELSVLILMVLTLERVHTIAYALQRNEKSKKKVAYGAAVVCILVSAFLATLPLVDINSYSRVAVCLPYLTEEWTDKMYIGLLLTINLLGFLVILFSYVYIFRCICKSPAAQRKRKDITVAAAKISLLILSAFVCWMPIVVIGYLALAGVKTVNTGQAKYLIVLVYPLNACLNPFIYAIFTRQFRQKISILCKRSNDRIGSLPNSRRSQIRRGSSAFLPISPRNNPTPMELINLRQSRRSHSLFVPPVSQNCPSLPIRSPPVLSPPPGVNMGRRSSLPADLGASLRSFHLGRGDASEGSLTANNSTADISAPPFTFARTFCTNSQPNLNDEESDLDIACNLQSSLGGSQDSANRQLPDIPEEQEEENACAYSSCSEDYCDAREEVREDELEEVLPEIVQTVELDSNGSAPPSIDSINCKEENENTLSLPNSTNFRESVDSAYCHGNYGTHDTENIPSRLQSPPSPTSSCTLSRGSSSFSSYDLTLSDSEEGREITSALSPSPQHKNAVSRETTLTKLHRNRLADAQTCLDSQMQVTHSMSHKSRSKLNTSYVPTCLESPHKGNCNSSNSQTSIVGSETSI